MYDDRYYRNIVHKINNNSLVCFFVISITPFRSAPLSIPIAFLFTRPLNLKEFLLAKFKGSYNHHSIAT